jgi:hypothetical protein
MFRYKNLKGFYSGQVGFISNYYNNIDFLVLPLWKQLNLIWTEIDPFVCNIQDNLLKLQLKIKEEENL